MEVMRVKCVLTGFPLRAGFMDELGKALGSEETVTLALMDVDGFFQVNEKYGHESGDKLLAAIGQVLSAAAERLGFQPGRIGGDEFGLIMPGTSLERGFLIAEELRKELNQKVGPLYTTDFGTGFSFGVASCPRDAKGAQSLLHKADHALYSAKEGGRNQVSLPATEEMVMKSCYYSTAQLFKLKRLAEQTKKKESILFREALDDLLRKYDQP